MLVSAIVAFVASVYLINITVITFEYLCNEQKQWAKDNDEQLYSMWQVYSVNLAMYILGHLNIWLLNYHIIYSSIHTYIATYNTLNHWILWLCIIIYTVLQSVWEHVGCVNRPISGSANTRSCHVLLRIDKLLQHVSSLLVSSGSLLMLQISYIANHSR